MKSTIVAAGLAIAAACTLMDNEPDIVDIAATNGNFNTLVAAGQRLSVATVNGAEVHIDGRNGVKVEDSTVTTADIIASNGVIHVIDAVLLP